MTAWMVAPLVVSVVLALAGGELGRRMPPATAVPMLTLAALVTALSTGFVLTVAAFVSLAQLPPVAALGRWSARALAAGEPLPLVAGALCGLVSVGLMAAAVRRVVVATRDLAVAQAACRRLGAGTAGLVVVQDAEPDAYALPGLSGRVVVSTAMLRALPAPERRVLLAHEAAHLRRRHYLYVQLAELSAAANPLLRPVAVAVRRGVERWADEDAAAAVGDRVLAARAVARASLAQRGSAAVRQAYGVALRMADSLALARTSALLAPAPRPHRPLALALAALVLAGAAGAVLAGHDTEHLFEVAEIAFSHRA
jgi:hypothetical protein